VARRRRSPSRHDGILVVDKPSGPTSHDVVETVRRATGEQRIGHTGTLDPAATGVLVLCLGRSTKLVRFLQASTKTYAARMVLGVTTASQDADGEVVATRSAAHIDERTFCEAMTRFQGDIEQLPPMVSAVRVGGRRLHDIAREGGEVEREPRLVHVHDLVLDRFEPGERAHASFLVTCSAGTYVRTLAHDIGELLGVGGSLVSLRRSANGPFVADEAASPDEVVKAAEADQLDALLLTPLQAVERTLPTVDVDDPDLVLRLTQGGRLPARDLDGPYAVRSTGQLIGIYRDRGDEGRPELVWTRPQER
jgi:tRNA pseudouridine55 synthase